MSKPEAFIYDWVMVNNRLIGKVKNHPHLGDNGGREVRTSNIIIMDSSRCETANTVYILGDSLKPDAVTTGQTAHKQGE